MKHKYMIAAALAAAALVAEAQPCSMDSLAAAIAGSDPAWHARQAELRAAELSVRADATLPGVEAEGEYLWGTQGENRWGFGVSQSFDWPGVYAARRQAAGATGRAFAQLARAERVERTLAAKLALIDLVAARRRAAKTGDVCANLRRLADLTQRALDHGQATILDLRKLQIALLEAELRQQQAEQTRTEAIAALQAMGYGREVPEGLAYPADADHDVAATRWQAMPSVLAARAEAEAAEARARAAQRGMLPGFSLGYRHQMEGGQHFNGLSVGISLPAWGSDKQRRAALAEAEAARWQSEAALSSQEAALQAALLNVQALEQRVRAYDRALDTADYPELLEKSLNGGQISMLTYIQELNFFLEAEMERIDAEQQYQAALAGLQRYTAD